MLSQLLPLALAPVLAPVLVASTPVSLTPRQSSDTEDCFARTTGLTDWGVSRFDFHQEDSQASVSFALTNSVLGTLTMCSASSDQPNGTFTGGVEYECEQDEESGESFIDGAELSATSFTFDPASGELTLKQSWSCRDNPQLPSRIVATGGEIVPDDAVVLDDLVYFPMPVEDIQAIA